MQAVTMKIDTGSTGIAISASNLVNFAPESGPIGWEFLSSSKRLWVGHWIKRDIVFLDDADHRLATARVPVLAVETEYLCPDWNRGPDQPACDDPRRVLPSPKGIAYMGVGFGREHDGQPQGTPDKNPFLNLVEVSGRPVTPTSLHTGYGITHDGVELGLTAGNSGGVHWSKLEGRSLTRGGQPASTDPRDWPQASMAVSVDGQSPQSGSLLVDTGVAQMYLSMAAPSLLPTERVANPSRKDASALGLADGTRVEVTIPNRDFPIASYAFKMKEGMPGAPATVLLSRARKTAFVNTGRHFLESYDLFYDAEGGWLGFRRVGD